MPPNLGNLKITNGKSAAFSHFVALLTPISICARLQNLESLAIRSIFYLRPRKFHTTKLHSPSTTSPESKS